MTVHEGTRSACMTLVLSLHFPAAGEGPPRAGRVALCDATHGHTTVSSRLRTSDPMKNVQRWRRGIP